MKIIIISSISIFLFFIFIILLYNRIAKAKNQIQNAISSLDALFIKRSDLIPNLVTLVKQYMNFEVETLDKITSLRTASSETNPDIQKEGEQALKNLFIQVENYPELKANTQFTNLQYSWNEVEEQISAGRRYVSSSITQYNDTITTFPGNIVAALTGNKKYQWEYATTEQQQNINAENLF